jgi:hypothetical protein
MSMGRRSNRQFRRLAAVLVLVYALRALIPVGFMPAGNGDLALRICPEGFPAVLLAGDDAHAAHQHHDHDSGAPAHDHKSWMSGHCVFGAAASAPPLCHSSIVALASETDVIAVRGEPADVSSQLRFRIAQPRGPPSLV